MSETTPEKTPEQAYGGSDQALRDRIGVAIRAKEHDLQVLDSARERLIESIERMQERIGEIDSQASGIQEQVKELYGLLVEPKQLATPADALDSSADRFRA